MKRTQFYIPEGLYQQLEIEAKAEKRAIADLVRELLNSALKQRKKTKKNIFADFAKLAEVGPKDLSTNYKKFLFETKLK